MAQGLPYQRMKGQQLFEFVGVRKDGTTFPVEIQGSWVLDGEGFPLGVRLLGRDISERQQQEIQARQSQKLESLGELVAGIAHNFNNLFTAVLGNLYMLSNALEDRPGAQALVTEVEASARQGARIIRSLLEFACPQLQRVEQVDLGALIADVAALVEPSLPAGVTLFAPPTAGEFHVRGERDSLAQILVNLLMNARDAAGGGGPNLDLPRTSGPRQVAGAGRCLS